jgi:hypothetical protein
LKGEGTSKDRVRSLRAVAQTHVLKRMIKFRSDNTLITFDCKKLIDATSYYFLEVKK